MAGWKRLASATADGSSSTLSVSFTANDVIRLQVYGQNTSGAGNFQIRFNNDTTANRHKTRRVYDGAGASGRYDDYSSTKFISYSATSALQSYMIIDVHNIDNEEHLVSGNSVESGATGAGSTGVPHTVNWFGKYTQKTPQVTSVQLITNSNNLNDKSYIVVLTTSDDVVSDEKTTLADATVDQSATQSYNSATTNVTLSNSNLTATSTSTAWGNRAYSTLSYNPSNLTSGQTYEFKFTMGDITKNGFMGFDKTPTTISGHGNDNNSSGVDYGFYLVGNGSSNNYLTVSEQGTEKWQSSSNFITSNTIFKITVDSSGVVKYYADATDGTTLRYTSGTAMSGDFYVLFYPYDSGFTTTITSWSNGLETVSTAPNTNTRYEETDTRKIYRFSRLKTGCKAYYKFDSTSGGLTNQATSTNGFTDGLGSNVDGTVTGATTSTDKKLGTNSYLFDGNDYVVCGSTSDFNFAHKTGHTVTVAFWFKQSNAPSGGEIIVGTASTSTGGSTGFYLGTHTSGRIFFSLYDGDATTEPINDYLTGNNIIPDTSNWYHYVFTFDDSNLTIYRNGSQVATTSYTASSTTTGNATNSLTLGKAPNASGNYLDGRLDDMGIWDRVLSTSEISELYNSGTGKTVDTAMFWTERGSA